MRKTKIALMGVCNSRNVLVSEPLKDSVEVIPWMFQPCFLDITKEGLAIPYKDFFKSSPIENVNATAIFTRMTMHYDLNKTGFATVESFNPNFLLIDLSTLGMRTYRVSYKGNVVYSCNAYSPDCYEYLQKDIPDLKFEAVTDSVSEVWVKESLFTLAEYLKGNWNLNKVLLFKYAGSEFYRSFDGKIHHYPENHWSRNQTEKIKKYCDYFSSLLPEVKVFTDVDLKVCEDEVQKPDVIPSTFHTSADTRILQGLEFKKFLFHEDCDTEIEVARKKMVDTLKENGVKF